MTKKAIRTFASQGIASRFEDCEQQTWSAYFSGTRILKNLLPLPTWAR